MNTWLKVARYHLLKKFDYLALPWAWTAFGFAVDLVIFAMIPVGHGYHQVLTAMASSRFRTRLRPATRAAWADRRRLLRSRGAEHRPGTPVRVRLGREQALLSRRDRAARRRARRWQRAGDHLVSRVAGTGRFFTALSAAGLTGLLAVLAAALLAGGCATFRRVAV